MKNLLLPVFCVLALNFQAIALTLENSKIQPVAYARVAPVPKTIIKINQTVLHQADVGTCLRLHDQAHYGPVRRVECIQFLEIDRNIVV